MNNLENKVAVGSGGLCGPNPAVKKRRYTHTLRCFPRLWRSRPVFLSGILVVAFALMNAATPPTGNTSEAQFLAENDAAMTKMMTDMDVHPSGDVDADFVAMMVPHHQGAIDMAQAELRYGRNEQLRRLAQEIIVEQQQEIAAMRLATGQPLPPSAAAPDQLSAIAQSEQKTMPKHSMSTHHEP
jgi:Domain of unknown function (DUF305)